MNTLFTNKTIVITGGASGLGKSLADQLIEKGAKVIILDQKETTLEHFIVDITKLEIVKSAVQEIIKKHGHIDIWINNAGIWMPKENTEQLDLEKGKKLFDINVFGTMNGIQTILPHFKKQNNGMIVNIISTTAFEGMNGTSGILYVGSKYALRGITHTLRDELKDTNLKIIGVYPGGIKTDIFKDNAPHSIDQFMAPIDVAQKIIANIELDNPETEQVLKRPGQ